MALESLVVFVAISGTFITMISYVVFGQVTVRSLRKNPETKHALGIEFASGWDIINVAQTLALPRALNRLLESSPLSSLSADSTAIFKHTTKFDRVLASLFYWSLMLTFSFYY